MIERASVGSVAGDPVHQYHMCGGGPLEIEVLTYGGHLMEVRVPDRAGAVTNVVLRLPDLLDPAASTLPPIEEVEMVSNVYRWIWPQGDIEFEDTFTSHA